MPAFNYFELNQLNYLDMVMIHLIYLFVKMFIFFEAFCFRLFTMTSRNHGRFFLAQ